MTDFVVSSDCLATSGKYIREKSRRKPVCMRCGVNGCSGRIEIEGPVERDEQGRITGPIEYRDFTTCKRRQVRV